MFHIGCGSHNGIHGLLHFRRKAIPVTTCSILGRIVHLQTALRSQWDKCQKNNSLFASPSIRRPTTFKLHKISQKKRVSIHAPAQGASRRVRLASRSSVFQFTPPHRGHHSQLYLQCSSSWFQISNPHFKWGSNFNPSGVFLWFRQRRDFAVPFLLVAS